MRAGFWFDWDGDAVCGAAGAWVDDAGALDGDSVCGAAGASFVGGEGRCSGGTHLLHVSPLHSVLAVIPAGNGAFSMAFFCASLSMC